VVMSRLNSPADFLRSRRSNWIQHNNHMAARKKATKKKATKRKGAKKATKRK
jgi:hypothetical protein